MEGVGRGGRWSWMAFVVEGVGRGGHWSWRAFVVEGVGRGGRRSWRALVAEGVGRGGRQSWRASVVEGVGRGGRRSWRALVVEGVGTMGSTWGPALGQSTMIAMITYRVSAKANVSQCIERAGRGKAASKPRTLNRKEDVGNATWTET